MSSRILLVLALLAGITVGAQGDAVGTIAGRVMDQANAPLPGVSVGTSRIPRRKDWFAGLSPMDSAATAWPGCRSLAVTG